MATKAPVKKEAPRGWSKWWSWGCHTGTSSSSSSSSSDELDELDELDGDQSLVGAVVAQGHPSPHLGWHSQVETVHVIMIFIYSYIFLKCGCCLNSTRG